MTDGSKRFPERDDLRLEADVVLRRHDAGDGAAIEWIHRMLAALATTGFPAPRPVPHFDGDSIAMVDGALWSAVSYVEGEVVGWATVPDMAAMGAFLATFHDAAAKVDLAGQRPGAFPVNTPPGGVRRERQLVHGDLTNHNVVAVDGVPCGAIDFMNAFVEVPLFDIGCALWRSGRPSQESFAFDGARIRDYVDGYRSVRRLSGDDCLAVVGYLRARGVQILAKHAARGVRDDGPRRRLAWLEDHEGDLVSVLIP